MRPMSRGTFRVNDSTGWSKGLTVTADGDAVIAHAGAAALRLTADRTGLTTALSRVLRRDGFTPGHDRGRVLTDTAVMMADGGNTVRGIDVLRHQRDLLGEVASPATLSRALGEVDQQALDRIDAARAQVRAQVWDLIVARHGLHPMAVMCDNTDECLADQLRAGTAGANDASDHIALLARAIAQIPEPWRHNLLITADGAGATHQLLNWLTSLDREPDGDDPGMRVEYTVGWPVDKNTGRAIALLPPEAWTAMIAADGLPGIPATLDAASGPDTVGEVAEITHLLPHLRHWPPGLRVFARRVKPLRDTTPKPLPGTGQLELDLQTRAAGWRYEAFATNAAPTQPHENPNEVTAWLDGRHRVHARVEDHFRVGNDTGADRLPSQHFAVNAAWQRTHAIACDLIAWLRLLGCDDALARTEPATLQYRIFHAPAILTRGGRRRRLNFPPHWPWTGHIQAIFTRLLALPAPTCN